MRRYGNKRDESEPGIVAALEKAGCEVIRLHSPVDLLVRCRALWHLIECKTPGSNRKRKDQREQQEFCARHGIPVVQDAEQALRALGLTGSTS